MMRTSGTGNLTRVILFFLLYASGSWALDSESAARKLFNAAAGNHPFPVLSAEYPDMTLSDSYDIQKLYVLKRLGNLRPAGFKAGLTNEATMQRFGASTALAAPLFPGGGIQGGDKPVLVKRSDFGSLMLETEIAFILGSPILEALKNEEDLRARVTAIAPAVELPDLSFADMKILKVTDIAATAISSRSWILGNKVPLSSAPDLNALVPILGLNGIEVNRGKGSDALGNQWKAALWLINRMISEGWTMAEGDILLTGALGAMLPALPGEYIYSIEPLGTLRFTVK